MTTVKKTAAILLCIASAAMTGCGLFDEIFDTGSDDAASVGDNGGFFSKEVKEISREELEEKIVNEAHQYNNTIHIEGKVDPNDMGNIISMITWKHPELFWITGYHISYDDHEADIDLKVIEDLDMGKISEISEELDKEAERIAKEAEKFDSDYEKALYVHDAIIEDCEYDKENFDNNDKAHFWGTAYGALVQHKAICQGYAEAYLLVMEKLGIECGVCGGIAADVGHAWNYVKLEGEYYWADLTWDDPFINDESGYLTHNYFLINDDLLYIDRVIDEDVEFVPECRSMDMNYYVMSGCFFDSYDLTALDEAFDRTFDGDKVEFMFADDETYEEVLSLLIDNGEIWQLSALDGKYDEISVYPIAYSEMRILAFYFTDK